jgi:hypothetical protein
MVTVEVDENGKEIPVSNKTSKEQDESTSSKETNSSNNQSSEGGETPIKEAPVKEAPTETVEGFNGNIVEHFSNSDYNFIITTALFIFFLFIIYNRYKN